MKFELPRGKVCVGCPYLEMEDSSRGWCTLEPMIQCPRAHDIIIESIEVQSSGETANE